MNFLDKLTDKDLFFIYNKLRKLNTSYTIGFNKFLKDVTILRDQASINLTEKRGAYGTYYVRLYKNNVACSFNNLVLDNTKQELNLIWRKFMYKKFGANYLDSYLNDQRKALSVQYHEQLAQLAEEAEEITNN